LFAEHAIIATATAQDADEDGVRPVAHLVRPHGTLYLWTLDGVDLEHSAKSAIKGFAIGGRDLCDALRFTDVEWTPGSARLALEETLAGLELDEAIVGYSLDEDKDDYAIVTFRVEYYEDEDGVLDDYTPTTKARIEAVKAALKLHGLSFTDAGSDDRPGTSADERTEYFIFSA
jgi:hypothetical protein